MCDALLSDPHSRLRQLWGEKGWVVAGGWQGRWQNPRCWQDHRFFDGAAAGHTCNRNWYEGNPGEIGEGYAPRVTENWVWPHFERSAPALLGFDESIDRACSKVNPVDGHANNCITSNLNILSLYPPAQYNICRNYEWQVCAARGWLPGQGGNAIVFAYPPGSLVLNGGPHPLGSCNSYAPEGCGRNAYGSGDIFYLEVCLFNTICKNGHELFAMHRVGRNGLTPEFRCQLDQAGVERLKQWLMYT